LNLPFLRDPRTSENIHQIEVRIRDNTRRARDLAEEKHYLLRTGRIDTAYYLDLEIQDLLEEISLDQAKLNGMRKILERFNVENDPDPNGLDIGRSSRYGSTGLRSRNTGSPKPRGD